MPLKNTPDQGGIKHLKGFLTPHSKNAINQLTKDSRVIKNNFDFKNMPLESFLIKLILDGDDLGMKAVSNAFSFEAIFVQPSILALISNKLLQEEKVITVLIRMQDILAKEFEVKSSVKIESIAWDIYDRCSNFTLVDFIKFTVMCKESHFKSKYQHITSKGINREYFQEWLQKYEELRQKALTSIKHQFNAQPIFTSKLAQKLIPRMSVNGKLIVDSKIESAKFIQLKREYENQDIITKDSVKFINAIAYDFFIFDPLYKNYSEHQIWEAAKKRACELVFMWKEEYQLNPPSKSGKINESDETIASSDLSPSTEDNDGDKNIQRKPVPTQKDYYEAQISIFLNKNKKRIFSTVPFNNLYLAIINEIKENDFSLTNELQNWFPVINLNETNLEEAASKWAYLLLKKFSGEYKTYKVNEIKNNTFPYSRKEYLWRRTMRWICDNCYNNPQNFTLLKLENHV